MTLLAGVVSRSSSVSVPDALCEALRRNISRNPKDVPVEFRDPHAFLLKLDTGAFGRPAFHISAAGSLAMLAGEPLLTLPGFEFGERDAVLEYLHDTWDQGRFGSLSNASGTFCAAHYDPRTGMLRLMADRLGLRPLYYIAHGPFVYFSGALRLLEQLEQIPKKMDVLSIAEITGFGYPFAGGTPYHGIKMLEPCEIATFRRDGFDSSRYFRWESIATIQATEEESRREVLARFRSAVRRRLRGDSTTSAYLSGGLDSRCVVAGLRAEGARVYTFNFSPAKTQDQVFGAEYARQSGAIHHEVPADLEPNWSGIMAQALDASPHLQAKMPERPRLVWSGEGGSVGLGHVYVSPEIVSALSGGDINKAIEIFLRQQRKSIPTKILNSTVAAQLDNRLKLGLKQELDRIGYPDPLRALYIFLNLNGPRRHLVEHFETIDRHRLEFQMPFFDSELLEYVTALPMEPFLYHEFYVKWLSLFDPAVLAVPWQAYPGHVPSRVPIPEDLPDQWSRETSSSYDAAVARDLLDRTSAMLAAADFPRPLLHKTHLRLIRWAWKLNLRNYAYALRAALTYYHYWKMSAGSYHLPASHSHGHENPS